MYVRSMAYCTLIVCAAVIFARRGNSNRTQAQPNSSYAVCNLALAAHTPRVSGGLVILLVSEAAQGGVDLNGDGDADDLVLHVFSAPGVLTNVGLAASTPLVGGQLVAFVVPEASQGHTDLNGDGDSNDFVVHVFDARSGTARSLGL